MSVAPSHLRFSSVSGSGLGFGSRSPFTHLKGDTWGPAVVVGDGRAHGGAVGEVKWGEGELLLGGRRRGELAGGRC